MSVNGLVVMTPTSIASTGTGNSSSIGANGKVTFSSCATLSLNGVFTSSYDNYMIVYQGVGTAAGNSLSYRLRASGTDATGSNYTDQYIFASSTTVSAARTSLVSAVAFLVNSTDVRSCTTLYVFGPNLAQPTAFRSVPMEGRSSTANFLDDAATHGVSTSYDGITFFTSSNAVTGTLCVYGFNQ